MIACRMKIPQSPLFEAFCLANSIPANAHRTSDLKCSALLIAAWNTHLNPVLQTAIHSR